MTVAKTLPKHAEDEGLLWWRVEISKEGGIKECRQVEYASTPDRLIAYIYVQADDKAQACSAALAWYERRKEIRRKADSKRNIERKNKGICRNCTQKICSDSSQYCANHLKAQRAMQKRWQREGAQPLQRPRLSPVEAIDRQRDLHRDWRRQLIQLPKVLEKFDELNPVTFRQWLVNEIEERKKKQWPVEQAAE